MFSPIETFSCMFRDKDEKLKSVPIIELSYWQKGRFVFQKLTHVAKMRKTKNISRTKNMFLVFRKIQPVFKLQFKKCKCIYVKCTLKTIIFWTTIFFSLIFILLQRNLCEKFCKFSKKIRK
jgi:hypothetical protein